MTTAEYPLRSVRLGFALALGLLTAAPLQAQRDTIVVAGREYAASALQEALLGDDYRDVWVAPVRVEVLDLDRFAGGLTLSERGGGKQTRSLRFRAPDGREYVFRSVNKYPDLAEERALEGTVVAAAVRDQISSIHPTAALVLPPLLAAVGVLHVEPHLVVMPDDPRLGEFREEFAGMLGLLELRPDEVEGGAAFGGYERVIGTDRLGERLRENPAQRVDARAYATARLVDLLVGDWDRHADQWRWAGAERGGVTYWLPIPRDRDFPFVDYDGALPSMIRFVIPNAVSFGPRIRHVDGLTRNARALDRRLLAELDRAAWDSIAVSVQARITDAVIEDAVSRIPPEYAALSGDRIARYLRSRRDDLDEAAASMYGTLSVVVDVIATDQDDLAVIERGAPGAVEVRLHRRRGGETAPSGEPYFRRRFLGRETDEVRVHLLGGSDHALALGEASGGPTVRVIGAAGEDALAGSPEVRGATVFHDARGDERFARAGMLVIEEDDDEAEAAGLAEADEIQDWGSDRSWRFAVDYQNPDGPIVGVGRAYTRYGFLASPYARRLTGRVLVAPLTGRAEADLAGDFHRAGSPVGLSFLLRASQLDLLRFYGFGNDTEAVDASSRYAIHLGVLEARAAATLPLPLGGELSVGPVVKYSNPDLPDDHPVGDLPPYGRGGFGQVGAVAEASVDRRDRRSFPRRGALLQLGASAYPGLWDADGAFGSAHAEARGYLPVPSPTETTLALRASAQRAWGEFPAHEAVFLGGSRNLRGFPSQRFAGDALLAGGAELRALLFPLELVVRGNLGALALADAGRVYYQGDSPGGWHAAYGGGLWFRVNLRGSVAVLSLAYARGDDRGRFYFDFGVPY